MTKILGDESVLDFEQVVGLFKRKGLSEWDVISVFGNDLTTIKWKDVKEALSGSDDE